MNRAMQIASFILLSGSYAAAISQTVYKGVDDEGNVSFTDRPSLYLSDEESLEVVQGLDINKTDINQITAMNSEPLDGQKILADLQAERAVENAAKAEQQEQQKVRATNCATAQRRFKNYTESYRIHKTNPDGTREYLNSDEIDKLRADTQDDVNEWCD